MPGSSPKKRFVTIFFCQPGNISNPQFAKVLERHVRSEKTNDSPLCLYFSSSPVPPSLYYAPRPGANVCPYAVPATATCGGR